MKQERIDLFSKLTEDSKMALTYEDFTISEIKELIDETPLSDRDRDIALMRYTKCMTMEQIANEIGIDIRTVIKTMPRISLAIKRTCTKLFIE